MSTKETGHAPNDNNASTSLPISSDVSAQEETKPNHNPNEKGNEVIEDAPRGFRFWSIIASLCVTGLLSALENTVITTSLPTIVRDLNVDDDYI